MKTSIILSAAALANAQTWAPANPNTSQASTWAGVDFTVGLTAGLFAPLVNYARDGDCFSYMMLNGLTFANYSRFFDKDFKDTI